MNIKNRLFLATAAILVCSYSILFFTSYFSIQQFTEDEITKDLHTALKFAKSQFRSRPDMVLEALKLPVSAGPVRSWFMQGDKANLGDAVIRWNRSLDFLEMVTFVDTRQKVIARTNASREEKSFLQGHLLDTLFSRRQPFIATELVSHDDYCREVKADDCQALPDNRDVMVQLVLLPVLAPDGSVVGAVVAGDDVNRDPHLPYQQQQVFGKTVEMLVTQMGERIASTMPAGGGLPQSLEMKVIQPLKGGFTFNGVTVLDNRTYEMIAEPIHNHKGEFIGSIAVALEKGAFSSINHENYRNLLFSALISIPMIFVLAFFGARQFAKPVRRLSDAVGCIESGTFAGRVPESGVPEFQEIYEKFNRISDEFAERQRSITRENADLVERNGELEKRVRDLEEQLSGTAGVNEAMLGMLQDGIVIIGDGQTVSRMNPAAEKLLGIRSKGAVGRHVSQLCQELRLGDLADRIDSMAKRLPGEGDSPVTLSHGGSRLRISIARLGDESGGLLLDIRDVSREGEVDRLKSDFIATVSHELKTPLTSMKGSLQFILKKGKWLTGVEREMLAVCMRNTERLISLIGSILEISRLESGKIPFAMKPVVVGELALYALEEIKGAALARNISFVNDIGFDLPPVYGDYDRLHQVMANLLSNAVKFSPVNSVVTLMAERIGNYLAISVCDDGKVIKPSDRDRLFTKFQQFSPSEDGGPGGSGLGLAICREIVERHCGTIHYAPGLAGGNIFTFTVPIYGEEDVQE